MQSPVSLRRLLPPAIVALSIVVVSSASVLAFAPGGNPTPASGAPVAESAADRITSTPAVSGGAGAAAADIRARAFAERAAGEKARAEAAHKAAADAARKAKAEAARKAKVEAARKAKAAAAAKAARLAAAQRSVPTYRGRNHVWIPSLGISRSTSFWSCSRATPVGNYVYRWGCAGSNNVYLFGHAHSVFRALHDAYVRHRLSTGMRVIYADGNGRVRTYRVRFWKVVSPTNGAWAFAAQSRPSLTLQTCVGSNSQYRLVVRLTQV